MSRGRMILCTWFTFHRFVYLGELLLSSCLLTHHIPIFKRTSFYLCCCIIRATEHDAHSVYPRGLWVNSVLAPSWQLKTSHWFHHMWLACYNLAGTCKKKKRKEKRKIVSRENIFTHHQHEQASFTLYS